ncbi:MAG: hypothetical protein JHD28_11320 [Bacteroidia bacterium]|nr:hypothetical protein [Bacteroidia bacterium]
MKPKAFSKIDSFGAKLILNGELSKLSNFSFINDTSNFIRQPDFTWINNNEILSAEVKNTLIRLILNYNPVKNKYLEARKRIAFTHVENPFSKTDSVSEAYRILALFRYWNIINYYFPYKTLIDKNWDSVLVENIPLFSSSNTYFDYFYRIKHLTSEASDSHADFTEIDDKKGLKQKPKSNTYSPTYYYPPIKVELINSKLIISDVLNDSLKKNGTIQKGDELLMINNYKTARAIASLNYFTANSTEQSFVNKVKYRLVSDYFSDTTVFNFILLRARDTVKVDNIQGLKWSVYWTLSWNNEKDTIPPYYTINDSLGYINLGKINSREIKKAISKYKNLPAIIFDMRGYPNGFAPIFLPKMFSKKPIAVANFYYPSKKYAGVFIKNKQEQNYYVENMASLGFKIIFNTNKKLFPTFNKVYTGKVIVLIDEEAASYAETVCMILKSYAKNAVFIGRPTQGSNGDIINFFLPGGINVSFSSIDWHFPDTKQLQRIGIIPDIKVERTVETIIKGNDAILERALEFIKMGR